MEQRPVGFQCKKNGSSITDKALQRIKACNNGMHNAESRCVRLHEWLQFYLNDSIMQREQEKEAVEMAQSICREALQMTQCKEDRKLPILRSRFVEKLYKSHSDSIIKTKCKRELSELSSKQKICSADKRREEIYQKYGENSSYSLSTNIATNPCWDYRLELTRTCKKQLPEA
ncbi:hypothetical protein T08_4064 [Trichinella sp. T8]|nr:hypothetical protein T08_4064 [Trichinella sp. T8]